ncbi:MAG: glycosyltransferase [Nitrospirota bacterium]
MKVSVIIPTYNRAQYICQAIESVLQQTMKDYGVIVVDDGSTDNTREVITPYLDKIKYIYTDNCGPAHARNVGMKAATGEYISWLDSDDLYYPYKLELQSACLDKFQDVAMVCTEASAFDDSGYWDEYHLKKYHKSAYDNSDITYENIFSENILLKDAGLDSGNWENRRIYVGNIFDMYFQHLIVLTAGVMIRKNILEKIGFQNEKYWLFEEYDFVLRICKHYKAAFIDVPTYKLRYHRGQISATAKKDGIKTVIRKQERLLEIAEKYGFRDREYYSRNKDAVDKRLAILHKALAIPLLAKGNQPKIAREHLRKSAHYGHPDQFLFYLSFTPYAVRRIGIKAHSLLKMH